MARRTLAAGLLGLTLLWLAQPAAAGWAVSPIRIDFSPQVRTGSINVTNDGDATVHIEVAAMAWTQDAAGDDLYQETDDLIVFPKRLVIAPAETRVVRVGTKAPAVGSEHSYRLFLRERPQQQAADGTRVSILVNFGVPVFSRPPGADPQGEITSLLLQDGRLAFDVHNRGNAHTQLRQITVTGTMADGTEIFRQESNGWYLLAGSTRAHTVTIPVETCRQLQRLTVTIVGDSLALERSVAVDAVACPH